MARYSWDTNSLVRSLEKVKKLINKETDEVEKARLLHYYDVMNSTIYDLFYYPNIKLPLSKRMPDMLSSFLASNRYYDLLDPFDNAMYDNADLYEDTMAKKSDVSEQIKKATGAHVTKEQALSICYDFYKNLDDELFEHFKNFYDMRFNHLRFVKPKDAENLDYLGIQYYLYGTNESYVEVVGNNNPRMSSTMIHEAGHVIDNSMNPDGYLSEDFYYEVVSIFMQLVSYYKKAGNFDDLFYYNHLVGYLNSYYKYVNDAYVYFDLMQEYIHNSYHISPEYYESIRENNRMSKKEVDSFLASYQPRNISYSISVSMALCLFNIYKQDEKKGIENLKRFIRTVNRNEYNPIVLSDEFSERVSEEVKTLLTEANECFAKHTK